ncbi:protein stum [Rhopalosiphum padi]|uniref:protein stum n=1 Tax=Rhopalosiphum padi TaxID=40932 RepID=UPI00298D9FCD|nr:protein stum [Rhopalosiphum padi]
MNATGCLTALGDGGEAFVVISSDGDDDDDDYGCSSRRGRHRRRHAEPRSTSPRCPLGRPPTPPPPPGLSMATAEAYKSRPRRKDRGAFVVLPEPPMAPSAATSSTADDTQGPVIGGASASGRVSPFRGYGFKTPENGRSRASSPSSSSGRPLRRQSSEPRIAANGHRRPPANATGGKQLSASTKDLSATGKRTSGSSTKQPTAATSGAVGGRKTPAVAGKPPSVPTASNPVAVKSSPRKKLPATPRKPVPPKSPLPLRSPKTPRRQQPVANAVAGNRPHAAAAKPTVSRPPVKLSPRLPKKQPMASATASTKTEAQPKDVARPPTDNGVVKTVAATPTVTATTASTTSSILATAFDSSPTTTAPTLAVPTTTTTATTTVSSVFPITASTSATAIATTHATNAVASAVVDGGPIVTAVPPPAAIAANTLATLSVIDPPAATLKPPQSAMRPRDPPAAAPPKPAATVVVMDNDPLTEAAAKRKSVAVTMTTTPPLSYELQEIVVEPEIENQSGRTAVRLSVDADRNKTSSTASSSNGHKTVAWARPSEKIIVPAEVPRSAEAVTTKDPAYKRYARKLCGGGGGGSGSGGGRSGRRPTVGHVSPSIAAAADGRASKCWAAVWKRRPRPCGQCCSRKRSTAVTASSAEATSEGRRHPQWWRRCSDKLCCCCGKRTNKKKLVAATSSSSDHSVGALGIAPPTVMATDTFCGKLKRQLRRCCCYCSWCCGWCAVPKFVKRICCCCAGCRGKSTAPKRKSADSQQRSPFKCTGCCTNIPKLDAVFVDHSSVMKGAIPVLPVTLAWLCLVFNVIIPGAGTFSSGLLCLCVGKPRFTVNDTFQSRVGAFCVNFVVAAAQMFTVLFCLVGWGWSIWWGVIMLKMAKKYQKVKIIDQPIEAPVAVDHNHQI